MRKFRRVLRLGSFRFCGKSEVKGVVEYRIVRVFLRAGSSRFAKERTIPFPQQFTFECDENTFRGEDTLASNDVCVVRVVSRQPAACERAVPRRVFADSFQ